MTLKQSYVAVLFSAFFCILIGIALAGCVGAPVTQTTQAFCASLPTARALENVALAAAARKPTDAELAAINAQRASDDARCAQAASAPK